MQGKKGLLKKVSIMILVGIMTFPINNVLAFQQQSNTRTVDGSSTFQTTENARKINFDEDWRFYWAGDKNHTGLDISGAQKNDYDDSTWRKVDLPHDWSIEFDFNIKNSIVGSEAGYLDGGTGWYRKTFTLPEEMDGKRIQIRFGGVYMNSTVYVNGQAIGTYPNGYLPFTYDITDYLKTDGKSENVIAVKVTNDQPNSRWYSGSGIYRSVHLIVSDDVHIANDGVYVTTPHLEQEHGGDVGVKVSTDINNKAEETQKVQIRTSILNYKDDSEFVKPVTSDEMSIAKGETKTIKQDLTAKNPRLWGVNDPNLYKIRSEVLVNGQVVDTVDTRFGFRWFHFDANEGFSLNGEWMKLKGVCMHHDQGALGAASYYRAVERQMDSMIKMGANAIRVTHNPASDELLEICDKKGLLVIEEAFDTWYKPKKSNDMHKYFEQSTLSVPDGSSSLTWAEYDLKAMVKRGRNNPSIIMWSVGNEVAEANGDDKSIQVMRNLKKWADEVDGTRPVTQGADKYRFGTGEGDHEKIGDLEDAVGFNYAEANYDALHAKHPSWIIYGSETSSATKSRGVYAHPDSEGSGDSGAHPDYQQSSYDNDHVSWGRTASDSWIQDRDRKYIAGQFIWTGFDYIGEPTPWHNTGGAGHDKSPKSSFFGIVDTAGFEKDDYYLYQSQWTSKPMVHVLPHWNFEDTSLKAKVVDSNGKIPVRVYSNAKKIELFVNGVSQGEKTFATKTTNYGLKYQQASNDSTKLYQEWRLDYNYAVGTEIKAVAKDDRGQVVATDIVTTAGNPSQIALSADRNVIAADGYDLSYITVDIQDKDGHFMPTANNEVNFKVVGNGEIVGVDNGDPTSHERYKAQADGSWKRKAFNGKVVVIVKSTKESGNFTLTATGAGLAKDSVTVFTKATNSDAKDIIGYDIPNLTTNVNVQPTLPTHVNAILADGSQVEKAVTWQNIANDDLKNSGTVLVKGTVNDTKDSITLKLSVIGLVAIKDISIVTGVGEIPQLPSKVMKVYSNGGNEEANVTWNRVISAEDVKAVGEFELTGTVDGTTLLARCHVRVADGTLVFDQNISTQVNGWPKTTASYNQGSGDNNSDSVVDGQTSQRPCWNTWVSGNNSHAQTDYVALEFAEEHLIGKVGMWWFKDANCRVPANAIVEYSSDGTNWIAVTNQNRTNGFAEAAGQEEAITFTPVTTKYLRIQVEAQAKGDGNYYPLGISEFKVYEGYTIVSANTEAKLTNLKVNGQTIHNFNPKTYNYSMTLPFGSAVPIVSATTDHQATLTIIQAEDADSAAMIEVTAEDGRIQQVYTIQFNQTPAQLNEAKLSIDKENMKENEIVPLTLLCHKEDGSPIANNKMNIEYSVTEENGAHIEINNHQLYAYSAGIVKIKANVSYNQVTVTSNELTITILPDETPKILSGYDAIQIVSGLNEKPVLPAKVKAHYENALSRDVAVKWDEIESSLYNKYGSFVVKGHVDGETLQPEATIIIKDVIGVQASTTATKLGVPVSSLPEKLAVYYSDGTSKLETVRWDTSGIDYTHEGTVEISGYVGQDDSGRDNHARYTQMKVRITNKADELQSSANYARQWTGSDFPAAFASNTNDGADSSDRVEKINDTVISFNDSPANRWTNWARNPAGTQETVGIIFAEGGNLTQRYIGTLKAGFYKDSGTDAPANFKLQYYVPNTAPEVPDNFAHVTAGDLSDDSHWKDVENMSPAATTAVSGSMQEYHFDQVKTFAIRMVMDRKSTTNGIAITEIEAYGKVAKLNDSFDVQEILVNGHNIMDQLEGLNYHQAAGDTMPTISAKATHNASVTIVNVPGTSGEAKVIVTAENQDLATTKTYTLHFENLDKDIQSVAQLADQEVANGTAFESLGLPQNINVTLNDNTLLKVAVNWQKGDYQADQAKEYLLTGIIVLPDGITNTLNLKVQIKVTVLPQTAYSVKGQIDAGHTGVSLAGIPVKLMQNDQLIKTATCDDHGNYEFKGIDSGHYVIEIAAMAGNYVKAVQNIAVVNADLQVGKITLMQEQATPYIIEVSHINDLKVKLNTSFAELNLPKTVTVKYSDNTTQEVNIKWSTAGYQGDKTGEYIITGELQVANTINPSQFKAMIKVVVEQSYYSISGKVDTSHVSMNQADIAVKLHTKDDKQFTQPIAIALTDASGHYQFTNIPEGTYTLRITGQTDQYKEITKEIHLTKNVQIDLVLESALEDTTEAIQQLKTKLQDAKAKIKSHQYTESSKSALQTVINSVEDLLNTVYPKVTVAQLNKAYQQLDQAIKDLQVQKDQGLPDSYWKQLIRMINGAKAGQKVKAKLPADGKIPSEVLKALAQKQVILVFADSDFIIDGQKLDINHITGKSYELKSIDKLYTVHNDNKTENSQTTNTEDKTQIHVYLELTVIAGIVIGLFEMKKRKIFFKK